MLKKEIQPSGHWRVVAMTSFAVVLAVITARTMLPADYTAQSTFTADKIVATSSLTATYATASKILATDGSHNVTTLADTTCSAGSAITAATGTGFTCSAVSGGASGVFNQVLSATPTQSSTGLTNWWNQPTSATVTDASTGVTVFTPNQSGNNICARYATAPATPYTITILATITQIPNGAAAAAIVFGWSGGTSGGLNRAEFIYYWPNTSSSSIQVDRYSNAATFSSGPFVSGAAIFSPSLIWLRISDDGTTATYKWSADGVNFSTLLAVTKSGSFLGTGGGYAYIIFGVHASSNDGYATILSWTQT